MKIATAFGPVKGAPGAVAVFLFDDEIKSPRLPFLHRGTKSEVIRLIAAAKFKGGKDELVQHFSERALAPILILQGLGSRRDFDWKRLRFASGAVTRAARDAGVKSLVMLSEDRLSSDLSVESVTRAIVDGIVLGNWKFDAYKKKDENAKELATVTFYFADSNRKRAADKALHRARIAAECTNRAREYGTHPANVVTTEYLAHEAKQLSKQGLTVTILNKQSLVKLGMNLMVAVSKGSAMPPRLIIMDWHPRGAKKTYAFVGKGLVFDSGGLNIKTASMDEMKSDMCGAAAVLAAMYGVAQLKPACRVIGVIGAVENSIGPDAYRPSDIYTAYNGKTVEIGNTDAEGRLVLADALAYTVEKYKPSAIVDLATLTGAAVVALGYHADAVFSNSERLKREVMDAADRAGERMWHMPLFEEYSEEVKGDVAELRNSVGHRWGGACTAAAFLKEFVSGTPWVHIDIAPSSYPAVASPVQPKNAVAGTGVRTLLELLKNK